MLVLQALTGRVGSKEETRAGFGGTSCLRSSEAFRNEQGGHRGQEGIWTIVLVLEMGEVKDLAPTHSKIWLDYQVFRSW
jgi:hypothetical protein